MDTIINYLLLAIIFVFDPLAISLVIAANFAFAKLKGEDTLYKIIDEDDEEEDFEDEEDYYEDEEEDYYEDEEEDYYGYEDEDEDVENLTQDEFNNVLDNIEESHKEEPLPEPTPKPIQAQYQNTVLNNGRPKNVMKGKKQDDDDLGIRYT